MDARGDEPPLRGVLAEPGRRGDRDDAVVGRDDVPEADRGVPTAERGVPCLGVDAVVGRLPVDVDPPKSADFLRSSASMLD